MPALDNNIIVRHLTGDNPDHSPRARQLFQQLADGTRSVSLREAVLVESVQVFSSKVLYNLPRQKNRDALAELIRMPAVKLRSKPLYLRALELYGIHSALSFVDCLLAAAAEREDGIVMTFDQDFDRVSTIIRTEP
jgi:predicted nucleic acid-binding protein